MGAELRRTGEVYTLLGALGSSRPHIGSNAPVNKAIGIMETTYYTKLSVSDICRGVGLERAYFSTLFKSATGVSPHAFLTKLRIEKAATLIQDGCSVSEAAESVGLSSVNFARQCRRVTGKSPLELKNNK
jgi:AraC-like DNA-binding protein